ncbi:MAG TPA: ABC transporter permease [Kiritimatiellia bacterium]|nr:ABC transporter permease [Kiritimatiellia bacterium]HRZ11187.1 ABC transporter permease [Kiritimatiellia bacterium]HSA19038.1 ABC transporter permease [Kiritimatiellia bacterium]
MKRILVMARVVWLDLLRRKDLYVMAILLLTLLFVLMSLNLFGLGAVVRYILDVGLLMAWLFSLVLVVSLTARQLPREESRGTIFPLLAKPLTRAELLLGKWLGSATASVFATLAFYAVIVALTALRGGAVNGPCLGQAFLLHGMALALVSAVALALSARMTYGAAASMTYVLCGAAFFVAPAVPELLVHEPGPSGNVLLALYYALPHLDLFDLRQRLIHDWGPAPWADVVGIAVYGAVWTGLFLLLAWLAYRTKRFRRGAPE